MYVELVCLAAKCCWSFTSLHQLYNLVVNYRVHFVVILLVAKQL